MLAEAEPFTCETPAPRASPASAVGAIYPVPEIRSRSMTSRSHRTGQRAYGLDVGWNCTAASSARWTVRPTCSTSTACTTWGSRSPARTSPACTAAARGFAGVIDPASRGRSQKDGEQLLQIYDRPRPEPDSGRQQRRIGPVRGAPAPGHRAHEGLQVPEAVASPNTGSTTATTKGHIVKVKGPRDGCHALPGDVRHRRGHCRHRIVRRSLPRPQALQLKVSSMLYAPTNAPAAAPRPGQGHRRRWHAAHSAGEAAARHPEPAGVAQQR
jgi:hypothetical protein